LASVSPCRQSKTTAMRRYWTQADERHTTAVALASRVTKIDDEKSRPLPSFKRKNLPHVNVCSQFSLVPAFRSFSWWVGLIRVNVFVGGWFRPEAFKN
jgi:hypothetical protein